MSKKKRPVAIDCANTACQYLYNANGVGDSLGPIEAYRFWKGEGHNKVKVFVYTYRIENPRSPSGVMDNIDDFLSVIPRKDRPLVPSDGDDDSYFIKWAVKNDAILVSNDRLRDHHQRLSGKELERFKAWLPRSRCGFTFIDDEFFPDPNFDFDDATEKAVSNELGETEDPGAEIEVEIESGQKSSKKKKGRKREKIEIPAEELLELDKLTHEEQVLRNSELEEELSELRTNRNALNDKVKETLASRNALNKEVAKQIGEVKELKDKRNRHNLATKKLKEKRRHIDIELKAARKGHRIGNVELKELQAIEENQIAAHNSVLKEVAAAQDLHESMIEISNLVDGLRLEANENHQSMMKHKEEADAIHNEYIEKLARKMVSDRIIREGIQPGPETTQPTDETAADGDSSLAELLENKGQKEMALEFDNVLRGSLEGYKSKSGRREHIVDRIGHEYSVIDNTLRIASSTGWFLGTLAGNKQLIEDAFTHRYGFAINISVKKTKLNPKEEVSEEEMSNLSVKDLRILAREKGLSGYSNMKKEDLIRLIEDDITENEEISGLTIDDARLDISTEELVREKTANIEPSDFFECLFSKINNPKQWTVFTTPYAHMVAEKPEFRLKTIGVNTIDFLRLHSDRVELGQRKGHPWIRRK